MPNNTQTTNTTKTLPLHISTKGMRINLGGMRGQLDTSLTLESVRDKMRAWHKGMDPVDHSFPLNMYHFDFDQGMLCAFHKQDKDRTPLYFTTKGFKDIMGGSFPMLPSRGGNFIEQQCALGEYGRKVSKLNLNLWASTHENFRMQRTVRMRLPNGKIGRVIRSQHSTSYAQFDNYPFVELLLNDPTLNKLQVVSASIQPTAMSLRFAMEPLERLELNKPIGMFEIRNSETGNASTSISYGIYTLECNNGMTSYHDEGNVKWRHYGNVSRIEEGVQNAMVTFRAKASGMLKQYDQALETAIDREVQWLEAELTRFGAPQTFIDRVEKALDHETSTQRGTLANVIDGITLAAQGPLLEDRSKADLIQQWDMEQMAHRILERGLMEAKDGRIKVPLKVKAEA